MIVSQRKPDGGDKESHSEGNENQELEANMEDLLRAISAKDAKHMALALQSAFECMEAAPHEESEEEPSGNTYAEMNAKAGREEQE